MNKQYTFTIITPAYNSAEYITDCILSVANANYDLSKIEHIVVDDGSTDDTANIVKDWQKKYPHLKYIKKENGNWGSVINYVKNNNLVHNDYVLVLDSDDKLVPNAFKRVNKNCRDVDLFVGGILMTNNKHLNVYVSPCFYIFKRNLSANLNSRKEWKRHIITPVISVPCNTYIKREVFNKISDLREGVSYQDTVMIAKASHLSKSARYTNKVVAKYWKWREGNTMSASRSQKAIDIYLKNFQEYAQLGAFHLIEIYLVGIKPLRKYCLQHKIKINLKGQKVRTRWLPIWASRVWKILRYCVFRTYRFFDKH